MATVRPAQVEDLPMVLRAERDYIAAVEPAQMTRWLSRIDLNLALWIENLSRTSVAEVDGEAAGFAMWTPDGGGALLVTIEVLPAFRRRGLALQLLEVFGTQAAAVGLRPLRLGAHEDNPARPLYERVGFREVGRDGAYVLYER